MIQPRAPFIRFGLPGHSGQGGDFVVLFVIYDGEPGTSSRATSTAATAMAMTMKNSKLLKPGNVN